MENWQIKIVDETYRLARAIHIFRRTMRGIEILNNDGTATVIKEGDPIPEKPFAHLEPEQLQALADELAKVGYKPQKGFIEGKLEATENHLKDLRKMLKL